MERPLLYYAASLTGDQDSGLDVLQDSWIKAFRGIHKLRDPGSLRPWLYAIVHGIAIDRIRQRYSRENAEQAQLEDFQEADEPSFAEEDAAALHRALGEIGACYSGPAMHKQSHQASQNERKAGLFRHGQPTAHLF